MAEWNNISNEIQHFKEFSKTQKPCFKHAAENLAQLSRPDANPKTSLCDGCSKTMLSYIFLIQDVLDALARKLSQNSDSSCCKKCPRPEYRPIENGPLVDTGENNDLKNDDLANLVEMVNDKRESLSSMLVASEPKDEVQSNQKLEKDTSPTVTTKVEVTSQSKRPRKMSSRRNSRRISRELKENGDNIYSESSVNRTGWQTDFLYNVSPSVVPKFKPYQHQQKTENMSPNNLNSLPLTARTGLFFDKIGSPSIADSEKVSEHLYFHKPNIDGAMIVDDSASENSSNYCKSGENISMPVYLLNENTLNYEKVDYSPNLNYSSSEISSNHFAGSVKDSSRSDDSGTDCLEKDENIKTKPPENENATLQNKENLKTLHDSFSDRVVEKDRKSSEAFVTICRNNAEALGCLVLGSSLLLSRTAKKLCVLVFDDVDPVFMKPLFSVFHAVQQVRQLEEIDLKNIEYLKQKNLAKLIIWNLVQFSKCVFLNPDCLILQNCDELFQHEELSAVPDIGWPDCFNTGVFVFIPSVQTLSELVELFGKQGQNNEGDQMLLNAYFQNWSTDLGKKLSFIYNLMRNASYTYSPAFQRYGHNVKIVQFLGESKPWEVKFFTQTGQLDGDMDVHSKHVRFFSEWINTFKIAVMKLFPQAVYSYAFNQNSISAEDVGFALCFFATYEEADQFSTKPFHIFPNRRTSPPFYLTTPGTRKNTESNTCVSTDTCCQPPVEKSNDKAAQEVLTTGCAEPNEESAATGKNVKIDNEIVVGDPPFHRNPPGSVIGDYQGMKAWEQGEIDYEGCDSSENIMNRLNFLIHRSM